MALIEDWLSATDQLSAANVYLVADWDDAAENFLGDGVFIVDVEWKKYQRITLGQLFSLETYRLSKVCCIYEGYMISFVSVILC